MCTLVCGFGRSWYTVNTAGTLDRRARAVNRRRGHLVANLSIEVGCTLSVSNARSWASELVLVDRENGIEILRLTGSDESSTLSIGDIIIGVDDICQSRGRGLLVQDGVRGIIVAKWNAFIRACSQKKIIFWKVESIGGRCFS